MDVLFKAFFLSPTLQDSPRFTYYYCVLYQGLDSYQVFEIVTLDVTKIIYFSIFNISDAVIHKLQTYEHHLFQLSLFITYQVSGIPPGLLFVRIVSRLNSFFFFKLKQSCLKLLNLCHVVVLSGL